MKFVVIGGGAAGFFCAINAARLHPNLRVIIVEKNNKLLSKVKVSGGGRCNVTNACNDIPELVKHYPRGQNFLKKIFHHFNTTHTIEWFAERGVKLNAEADGRIFPSTGNSQTIIDCLLHEADKYGVEIMMNTGVVSLKKTTTHFDVMLSSGNKIAADLVCIACGGFSKLSQFDWIKQLGHTVEPPLPSLFTFNMSGNTITSLMGVSVENVTVKIAGTKLQEQGPLLITHWGMSGPVILRLSAWGAKQLAVCNYHFSILINWLPEYNEHTLRDEWQYLRNRLASQPVHNKNPFGLPGRLWMYLLLQCSIDEHLRWADLSAKQQNLLIPHLTAHKIEVKGKTTFKEEFVTCGGVSLSEIDANTMQSKKLPGLFFAGEIMDIDGITGGFNFQHAWTSGMIAAKAVGALP